MLSLLHAHKTPTVTLTVALTLALAMALLMALAMGFMYNVVHLGFGQLQLPD